ncbi:MAG: DNA mismatch repair protein MutS [Dehalococcoidia bacterium]|nr:DNA mismatch repair protein MutS [Dehalococcoidia bacterium]
MPLTPIRIQYLRIKEGYPDSILFFRMGDFYETFDKDASITSRELDIVLTSRSMGKGPKIPMAGVPCHAVDSYLAQLVKKGYKVAICEQLSEPSMGKGLVDRGVVRVVTPGTVLETNILDKALNNYLVALMIGDERVGLSYVDISTGHFYASEISRGELLAELNRLNPAEVLVPDNNAYHDMFDSYVTSPLPVECFGHHVAKHKLLKHFKVASLESFGCEDKSLAISAAGAILYYLAETQKSVLSQISKLTTYSTSSFMILDPQTVRNLELFSGGRWGSSESSLLSVLDNTRTPMGARLFRQWIGQPLLDITNLERRLEGVDFFYREMFIREKLRVELSNIADIERIVARILTNRASPRDLLGLKSSLETVAVLLELLLKGRKIGLSNGIQCFEDLRRLIDISISPQTGANPGEGDVISHGFSDELDELRNASKSAREFIASLEKNEREITGIKNLRVGYNRVFGYYLEISKSNLADVPDYYERRQTLANAERFVTPQLKEYEVLILSAKDRITTLERSLFAQVCSQIGTQSKGLYDLADKLAGIDILTNLAEIAHRNGYVKPLLLPKGPIDIQSGRHPMIEKILPPGEFVANDLFLSCDDAQILMITGPNMSGKSTFIRQAAIITLMAQIGSFVPADKATIGLVDRIFTRVGLQDDLSTGQSTFMVEMLETASIVNQATNRSLVILDEIGRGTSTYDGMSIARAVAEHIHNDPKLGCRTLFATHYHELTDLSKTLPRVKNFSVAVSEENGNLVFLHRIASGRSDKSYGVHVARLAGMPKSVIQRAWEILDVLEQHSDLSNGNKKNTVFNSDKRQIPLFSVGENLLDEILRIDITDMTPLQAINKLYELQEKARNQS